MKKYILAVDQGTTSSRAIVFDLTGNVVSKAQKAFTQYTPRESWVEHDADEIWESQLSVIRNAVSKLPDGTDSIAAIGITNQRETTILWDRHTGKPAGHAVVWQCRRSAGICSALKETGYEKVFKEKTGLVLDPYFSGTKIKWLLDNKPELRVEAEKGNLLFGTVDSWLLWNLTGGKVHATDVTNASRTLLMNIHTGSWDRELLEILNIPEKMLPEIKDSAGFFGESDPGIFGRKIPVTGIAGDQQASLFGHKAFRPGDIKNTYGTGCFMMMNIGEKVKYSSGGLLTTVAWGIENKLTYAFEGSVFMAGALLEWLRDSLQIVQSVQEISRLAEETEDNDGVYLVPSYQGLGAPWWYTDAKGALTGLTRASGREHVCRAYLESIAYRSKDIIDVMSGDSGFKPEKLKVDGGVTNSSFLMQFQSDILNTTIEKPDMIEVTAYGAAMLAALGAGLFSGIKEISLLNVKSGSFTPAMEKDKIDKLYNGWLDAVKKIK